MEVASREAAVEPAGQPAEPLACRPRDDSGPLCLSAVSDAPSRRAGALRMTGGSSLVVLASPLWRWPTPCTRRPSTKLWNSAPSRRCSTETPTVRCRSSRKHGAATGSRSRAVLHSSFPRWRCGWLGGSPRALDLPRAVPRVLAGLRECRGRQAAPGSPAKAGRPGPWPRGAAHPSVQCLPPVVPRPGGV